MISDASGLIAYNLRMDHPFQDLEIQPAAIENWADMEHLFEQMGSNRGCWCMWWRLKRKEFDNLHGSGNRQRMKDFIESVGVPGILAYIDSKPVAWCSIAPREQFPTLNRSPVLK